MPLKKKLKVLVFVSNPHPKSLAALELLNREYRKQVPELSWQKKLKARDDIMILLQQAGVSFTCAYCHQQHLDPFVGQNHKRLATLDHIIPISKGGSMRYENLAIACRKCNAKKGDIVLSSEERAQIITVAQLLGTQTSLSFHKVLA